MLTFIIPFLVGTIVGFLIRGKPSDTFAITTGKRVSWAIGSGFGGLLIGMPIGLAISSSTAPQIAGLIATGLWLGVLNILSIKNATYNKLSERKVFAWVCGAIVTLPLLAGFLPNEIRGLFPTYERDSVTDLPVTIDALGGQVAQSNARITDLIAEVRRRAEQGNADMQFNLGLIYDKGEYLAENDAEAVKWYRLAAAQGNADAQFNLGTKFTYGEGVPKNTAEAGRWFRFAADQGDAYAQSFLGSMYDDGEGVPENDAEAVKWFRLAADQGVADAQYHLGLMYAKGEGVAENGAEAMKWYRLAADQGFADAQSNLGYMYGKGEGVPESKVDAYFWWNLAAAQDNDKAKRSKAIIEKRMTREQIAEAQRRSAAWKPKTE